jgi:hypothetical protein
MGSVRGRRHPASYRPDEVGISARHLGVRAVLFAKTTKEVFRGGRVELEAELQTLQGHRLLRADMLTFVDEAESAFARQTFDEEVTCQRFSNQAERIHEALG